jgi:predicted transcriptional regulator
MEDICSTIEFIINNHSITGMTIPVDSGQNLGWKTPDLINIKE